MNSKLFCSLLTFLPAIRNLTRCAFVSLLPVALLLLAVPARSGDAPQWMHALVNAPLPAHDEKADVILLYSEKVVSVQSADKIKTTVREAYKILRPGGREYGILAVSYNPRKKITALRGWCIPMQGKDYEVKDKEAVEVSLPKISGSELISDVKEKMLQIPAPDPGNIVGYEYDIEEQPMVLQVVWRFQEEIPGREMHFSLQLPAGWEYKVFWINHPEVKATQSGGNQWDWAVSDVPAIRHEPEMPPIEGVAGQMAVSFFPPGGAPGNGVSSWLEMGKWYL